MGSSIGCARSAAKVSSIVGGYAGVMGEATAVALGPVGFAEDVEGTGSPTQELAMAPTTTAVRLRAKKLLTPPGGDQVPSAAGHEIAEARLSLPEAPSLVHSDTPMHTCEPQHRTRERH